MTLQRWGRALCIFLIEMLLPAAIFWAPMYPDSTLIEGKKKAAQPVY